MKEFKMQYTEFLLSYFNRSLTLLQESFMHC